MSLVQVQVLVLVRGMAHVRVLVQVLVQWLVLFLVLVMTKLKQKTLDNPSGILYNGRAEGKMDKQKTVGEEDDEKAEPI